MGNGSILAYVVLLSLAVFGLSQAGSYAVSGQNDDGVSISDIPFYRSMNGTSVSERVTGVTSEDPRIEVSFIEDAIVGNVGNVTNTGTYVEHLLPLDVIRGSGEGILTSVDNNSMIGWSAYDLGKKSDNGSFIFKGIIFFNILSPDEGRDNEFMFLDNQIGVYKSIVESDGGSTREIWALN